MRIRGQGPGFSGSRDGRGDEPGRVKRLRAKLSVGLLVEGVVALRREDGLYWVDIEDTRVLAALDGDVAPGTRLAFEVARLEPEITLRPAPRKDALRRLSRMV